MKLSVEFELEFMGSEPSFKPDDLPKIGEHLADALADYDWDMAIGPACRWTNLDYRKGKENISRVRPRVNAKRS